MKVLNLYNEIILICFIHRNNLFKWVRIFFDQVKLWRWIFEQVKKSRIL